MPGLARFTPVRCNVCGDDEFGDVGRRERVRCMRCGSLERTRVMMLHLERLGVPRSGDPVLHLAPEAGLADVLRQAAGDAHYRAGDATPENFERPVERLDLCADAATLPSDHYRVILHAHVVEHVPCNYTAVLLHLHRALHPDGVHLCSIPFLPGHYEDTWRPLPDDERTARFGQWDHVRMFGTDDLDRSLGMVFRLPAEYDLEREFPVEQLDAANIPEPARRGFTPHTVLAFRKHDLLIRER